MTATSGGTESGDAATAARDAAAAGNRAALRLLLHPYLHWTLPDGHVVRGRSNVLALLADVRDLPAPASPPELRDGQIYRWRC
ncbi:hypothetical protein [Naasia aerilata]|uniref:hypothetical protein n=1 Tax=Naasia aerilata TaxID=1162966 RepID=UPI0025729C5A|nr:hypothetical protein [Naasia aerilata]